mmetsp:Transcript_28105/g.61073  ORF Transcript_28105/g.61073 Transcript_28105/m.61073 type:complete len:224 (-) Transcript_28105:430-1101(-)
MDSDVEPVSEILQWSLIVVVCREVVGHQNSEGVHLEIVCTLLLHHLFQLNLALLHLKGLHGAYPRLVALLIFKPLDVLFHEREAHEANLHIPVHIVLNLVERPVEGEHVVSLTIGDDKDEQLLVPGGLKVVIERGTQCLCHGRGALRRSSEDSLRLRTADAAAQAHDGVEQIHPRVNAKHLEDPHPTPHGIPGQEPSPSKGAGPTTSCIKTTWVHGGKPPGRQ